MPRICYTPRKFKAASADIIEQANAIIDDFESQGFKLTLRRLYYQFVGGALLPNTQETYDRLGAIVSNARLAGLIDWEAIEDRTRWVRAQWHWGSPQEIVEACVGGYQWSYRIDRWATQDFRPEVWIEKDALVGIIEGVCNEYDVPYFACRGYVSQSEMWKAGIRAARYISRGQQPCIIHLGDHDPSGIDMTRDIHERLSLFANQDVPVERIALTMKQVKQYGPPPNPAKLSDARAPGYIAQYGRSSWELDALSPPVLVDLVRMAIERRRDQVRWSDCEVEEEEGLERLRSAALEMED